MSSDGAAKELKSLGASIMKRQSGFTLIELMITVAIIALLSAIALPSYQQYVIRARLTDAFSALASAQSSAEQFWSNNRTYVGFNTANGFPVNTSNFTYNLSNQTASTYTLTAAGVAGTPVAAFAFTIDQNGNKATAAVPTGWTASATCWVNKKGGICVQ
jgi:type IV pilus assembly protein PilE